MIVNQNFKKLDQEDKKIISLIIALLGSLLVGSIFGYTEYYDEYYEKTSYSEYKSCELCYAKYHFNYVILIISFGLVYCFTYLLLKKTTLTFDSASLVKFNKSKLENKESVNDYSTIIQDYRDTAKQMGIAPTSKTGDYKLISIYEMGKNELKNQFPEAYSKMSSNDLKIFILTLINIYELEGEDALSYGLKDIKTVISRKLKDFKNEGF